MNFLYPSSQFLPGTHSSQGCLDTPPGRAGNSSQEVQDSAPGVYPRTVGAY